ncbi:MAG TPA: zf-HC2 domain-containing protein [Thermoanaerobaculia bacterium]|nr:zf-HC2 domain-containing protein [Thermoanaerobaculia bacterium]
MNPIKREEGELAKLRRAFASVPQPASAPAACPSPEKIWEAVRGELPSREIQAIVTHMAGCAACAEDWRLAMALQRPAAGVSNVIPAAQRFSAGQRLRNWGLAAAAVLALGVFGVQWARQANQQDYTYRGEQTAIHSLVEEGQALPRNQFLLRWSAPETPGATYDVEVSTEDLRAIASGDDLREPQLLVPASALAGLPPGTRLLWKVDAELPQGEHVSSTTFVTTVQ